MAPPPDLEVTVPRMFWRAVTTLAVDRATARTQLQECFRAGETPKALDGRTSGYFLTTSLGAGVDPLLAPMARIWMPWKGKIFDAANASGRIWFADSARGLVRMLFPAYEGVTADLPGTFSAFRFHTVDGPSQLMRNVPVLRIDYDLPENPSWPIRRIMDELVQIGDDVYLGQALVRRGTEWLRAAWFALEHNEHASAPKR